jgi:eukaryotic-like serine/threonine-protein kinase
MRFTYSSGQRPLAGYTLKRGIGRGGFGEVYYAVSDGGKEVALKLVNQNADIELRGIKQCLNVKHANLVSLYDLRSDEQGNSWVVMEYVAGESLNAILTRHPDGVDVELARQWFSGLAAAIAYLHDRGIVHRDLKPGNIFLENGIVKVGDYGLSKLIGGSQAMAQTQSVGTVHYMAPEISTGNYNRSIDIYASGVILYEMLTGRVPFEGESAGEILMKHLTSMPDLSKLPTAFVPALDQALAKNPARRYRTITEMARDVAGAGVVQTPATPPHLTATLPGPAAVSPPGMPVSASPSRAEPNATALRGQVAETCGLLLKAAALAVVLSLAGTVVLQIRDGHNIAKAFFLTLACAWAMLIPSRFWVKAVEDSWLRRTVLLVFGLFVGLEATWLDGYSLSRVWADEVRPELFGGDNPRAASSGNGAAATRFPLAASYLAYFGLAFFATRWWKIAERQRERRFNFAAILAAAFWGYVLVWLLPGLRFPDPAFVALVSAAVIVQLVSPWQAPTAGPGRRVRLRLGMEASQ